MNIRWSPNWLRLTVKTQRISHLVWQCAVRASRSYGMFHNSCPPSTFQLKMWTHEQIAVCQELCGNCLFAEELTPSNYLVFIAVTSKHTVAANQLLICYLPPACPHLSFSKCGKSVSERERNHPRYHVMSLHRTVTAAHAGCRSVWEC